MVGFGYGTNLISQQAGFSPTDCHTACLNVASCQSFQTELHGYNYCNLYSASAAGNVANQTGAGYWFYDRDCQTFLPDVCTANAVIKRTVPFPPVLAGLIGSRLTSACKCVNTAPATVASTQQVTVTTTQTNVVSAVQTTINAASTFSTIIYT